jgi:hypothetical protein
VKFLLVKHIVKNKMELLALSAIELAKKSNAGSSKKISNYIKDKNSSELNFYTMVKICKVLFPNDFYWVLNKYCLEVELSKNVRMAIDYCSTNNQISTGNKLLKKVKDKEIKDVYKLVFGRMEEIKTTDGKTEPKVKPEEILLKLKEIKVKSPELKVLVQLLQSYAYQDQEKYVLCYESFSGLSEDIKKIKNVYFNHSLRIRHTELAGYICLRVFGDIPTSRKYCEELINNTLIEIGYKGSAYYTLGTSYMFEDFEKAAYYFDCSITAFQNSSRAGIESLIENYFKPKLYIMHGKYTGFETDDKSLMAYLYARLKNGKKALEYLEEYLKENEVSPFTNFIKGLIFKDPKLLSDSMARYELRGEMFFINLPRYALLELGEPNYLINDRIKYKMKIFEGMDDFEKDFSRNVSSIDPYRFQRQLS